MRKASFRTNHAEFENWIHWYGAFTLGLIQAKRVVRTKFAKMELLEALVLRVSTRWENLIEADIVASLNHDSSAYAARLGLRLRKHLSRDECEAIVVGHRYLDFRSFGQVKGFARKYLVEELNPFEAITPFIARKMDEFFMMRNYLAHYSSYARRTYYNHMREKYNYKRVPEPGAFLLSKRARSEIHRFSEYLLQFLEASSRMHNPVRRR
jgi:hypothetical protein